MYCGKCGKALDLNAEFCGQCDNTVVATANKLKSKFIDSGFFIFAIAAFACAALMAIAILSDTTASQNEYYEFTQQELAILAKFDEIDENDQWAAFRFSDFELEALEVARNFLWWTEVRGYENRYFRERTVAGSVMRLQDDAALIIAIYNISP